MTSITRNVAPNQPNRTHPPTVNAWPATRQQAFNVQRIIAVGDRLHVSDDVKLAAVSAAIVETRLDSSVKWRGSAGLYGQREGWGSEASRVNVSSSTEKFMAVAQKYANSHEDASASDIAQFTQKAIGPNRYAKVLGEAEALIDAVSSADLIGRMPTRHNLGL